jgi:hypothetical protein
MVEKKGMKYYPRELKLESMRMLYEEGKVVIKVVEASESQPAV